MILTGQLINTSTENARWLVEPVESYELNKAGKQIITYKSSLQLRSQNLQHV